jgi:hypothetical protein
MVIPLEFKSKGEVMTLFQVLQHEDISFHPDKKFEDYIDDGTGQKRYNSEQINLKKNLLASARTACTNYRLDFYILYRDVCLRVDLKSKLRDYLPILFELLGDQPFDWKTLNSKFSTNHLKRLNNHIAGQREPIEANFYDVISQSLNGNPAGARMLFFFRRLLEELADNLDASGNQKIRKTLYNLLVEPDHNYLNYIGELAVLNLFVRSDDYALQDIESPLGNSNGADFGLLEVATGKKHLIEVVSVRPQPYPETPGELKKFIEGKLLEKIDKKTKGNSSYLTFRLIPVLWGTEAELQWTADLLKTEIKLDVSNIADPCAFCTFTDQQRGGTIFRFGSLYSMFP